MGQGLSTFVAPNIGIRFFPSPNLPVAVSAFAHYHDGDQCCHWKAVKAPIRQAISNIHNCSRNRNWRRKLAVLQCMPGTESGAIVGKGVEWVEKDGAGVENELVTRREERLKASCWWVENGLH